MDVVEQIVSEICLHRDKSTSLCSLWKYLQKNRRVMAEVPIKTLDGIIEMLHPELLGQTLGIIFILDVYYDAISSVDPLTNRDALLNLIVTTENVIRCGNSAEFDAGMMGLVSMCKKYSLLLHQLSITLRGIAIFELLIQKLKEVPIQTQNSVTPFHVEWAMLCIMAKAYSHASKSQFLDRQFVLNRKNPDASADDFLRFHYYVGIIFNCLKMYRKSLESFGTVLWVSSKTVFCPATIAAYKKYLLVSLIVHGKILSTSTSMDAIKPTSAESVKHLEVYMEFVKLFEARKFSDIKEFLLNAKKTEVLRKDGNFGLLNQAVSALSKLSIQQLTKTFLTLSLDNIAKSSGLDTSDVLQSLLKMIEEHHIFCKINQCDGMVSFTDDPRDDDANLMPEILNKRIESASNIERKANAMSKDISSSKAYLSKMTSRGLGRSSHKPVSWDMAWLQDSPDSIN